MDEPSGMEREEANHPSGDENDGDNIKQIIHK